MPESNLKVVFGAMTFGPEGTPASRVPDLKDQAAMLDIFQAHGNNEIDTARIYGGGQSEVYLAQNDWAGRGLVMDTKLFPNANLGGELLRFIQDTSGLLYTHKPEDLRRGLMDSLKALNTQKIDLYYLHGPDRNTPYEDTLRELNKLYQEGHFNRWGVSNYAAWEVAQMNEICIRNNWIRPAVFQGVYNVFSRAIEPELIPCLRFYNMSFYVYGPLAGGLMTGKYTRDQKIFEPGSRFDPDTFTSITHRPRYWNDTFFDAIDEIKAAAAKHNLTLAEVALRWLNWHSKLEKGKDDAIIVGASSTTHLEQNLADLEKGSLPDDVVKALDSAYAKVKAVAPLYFFS